MQRSWGRQVGSAGAPFRFAPERGPDFFADNGWRPIEVRNSFHAAARMKRLPLFLSLLARLFPEPKQWRWNPKKVWGGIVTDENVYLRADALWRENEA